MGKRRGQECKAPNKRAAEETFGACRLQNYVDCTQAGYLLLHRVSFQLKVRKTAPEFNHNSIIICVDKVCCSLEMIPSEINTFLSSLPH